jgi:2-phospho-L-lactate guanylyltransferase
MRAGKVCGIVPVKAFDAAKHRMSCVYGPRFRRDLAAAMLEDVLTALSRTAIDRIAVVTLDADAARMAARFRAEVFRDASGEGHTRAVMAAAGRLAESGYATMLTIPGDIPLVTPEELSCVLAAHGEAPAFTIVPSRDGRGSNAVVMSPPQVIQLAFGQDSFVPHCEMARHLGIEPTILELPGLGLDIDNPSDLAQFMDLPSPTHTWGYLVEAGIVEATQMQSERAP